MAKKITISILLFSLLAVTSAWAGSDSASVPAHRIPWSGYWWPKTYGELVRGYTNQPSPLAKYDAYIKGYFPGPTMKMGEELTYNPNAPAWHGYCDAWAAASILEPEPSAAGTLLGIPFNVGDKKGLLTAYYGNNYSVVMYGSRYTGPGSDSNDIYPGGVQGFHQTLINYIAYQGLPIVIDIDPGVEVWNYPVYRYVMEWTDVGTSRYVTTTVWMADNGVSPDFVGTVFQTRTYTYVLDIDANGELLDSPGRWTGDSINNHPDFMWFPTSVGNTHPYLDRDAVRVIADSQVDGSDDRFEPNTTMETAHAIIEARKGRYYWASSQNADWFRVALGSQDDFYTFLHSPASDLDIQIFDARGNTVGSTFPNGAHIGTVPADGDYYVRVLPGSTKGRYYNISFYTSPSDLIPHIAAFGGWETSLNLVGREPSYDEARITLFGAARDLLFKEETHVPQNWAVRTVWSETLGAAAGSGRTAKVLNLDADAAPLGFFSYALGNQRANIPLGVAPERTLLVPKLSRGGSWHTGIALMNTNVRASATVRMTAFNDAGAVVGEDTFSIGAGQNRVGFVHDFGAVPDHASWMRFAADQPLQGFVLWGVVGTGAEAGLCGVPLLRSRHAGRVLFIPHLATYGGWETEVAVVSLAQSGLTSIAVTGYTAQGTPTQPRMLTLGPHGVWRGPVQQLFGDHWHEGLVWAKIEADQDLSGYQLFSNGPGGLAAMPLLTEGDARTELSVKFIPDLTRDWLGLALLNTSNRKTDIRAVPYDAQGNHLMGGGALWYNVPNGLGSMRSAVDTVQTLFEGMPPETRTLRIFSEQPLIGLGIYGEVREGRVDVLYLD